MNIYFLNIILVHSFQLFEAHQQKLGCGFLISGFHIKFGTLSQIIILYIAIIMASSTQGFHSSFDLSIVVHQSLNNLSQLPCTSSQFQLFEDKKKLSKFERYKVKLPRTNFLSNLEIYEWRNKTEFPIVKTKFVRIKNQNNPQDLIEIEVFNQHYLIRLNELFQLNIGQSLFLLKESLLGFERLFNRFGPFEIKQSMIAINEKGQCKVWLNDNFSLNKYLVMIGNQRKMITEIIQKIEARSVGSRNYKKLFAALRECSTFLQCLKTTETYIKSSRVLMPKKFIFLKSIKETPKVFQNFYQNLKLKRSPAFDFKSQTRFSFKSTPGIHDLSPLPPARRKDRTPSPSIKMKRFKSQNRLIQGNLKISENETAYSKSIKQIKNSNCGLSVNNSPSFSFTPKSDSPFTPNKTVYERRWLEDSSFIMNVEENDDNQKKKPNETKEKKQLTQSEAFKQTSYKLFNEANTRKYSANICVKFKKDAKKKDAQKDDYFTEFSSLLNRQDSSSIRNGEQEEEEDYLTKHMENVLKNNGWNNVTGLITECQQLKMSFHAKDEQSNKNKVSENWQSKLGKLGSLGRRQIAMSILPQQIEQNT